MVTLTWAVACPVVPVVEPLFTLANYTVGTTLSCTDRRALLLPVLLDRCCPSATAGTIDQRGGRHHHPGRLRVGGPLIGAPIIFDVNLRGIRLQAWPLMSEFR